MPERTSLDGTTETITLSSGRQILMPAASAEDLRERITETRSAIEAVIEDDHEDNGVLAAMIADRVVAPLLTELRQLGDLYVHACRGTGERNGLRNRIAALEANGAELLAKGEQLAAENERLEKHVVAEYQRQIGYLADDVERAEARLAAARAAISDAVSCWPDLQALRELRAFLDAPHSPAEPVSPVSTPTEAHGETGEAQEAREPLLDPDCRDGKHGSCVGPPCECTCHGESP